MQTPFIKSLILSAVTALAVLFSPSAHAQIVSAGMSGSVMEPGGKPVAGATVTAVHTPTNATYTAVTTGSGLYNFRGLPVGGPFTITASATGYSGAGTVDPLYFNSD